MLSALLVGADIMLRQVIYRALRARAEVDEASLLAEAWATFRVVSYDVVITDAELPDGSGQALLASVAEDDPRCRRVLTSARVVEARLDAPYDRFFLLPGQLEALIGWVDAIRIASRSGR